MLFIFFFILFVFFINYSFIIYNEDLLLALLLILFFIFIYLFLKKSIKSFIFFKIFRNFYIFYILYRLSYFYNKQFIKFCLIKQNFINKFKIKLHIFKNIVNIVVDNIFIRINILLNIISLVKYKESWKKIKDFNFFYILFYNYKVKLYDNLLFY